MNRDQFIALMRDMLTEMESDHEEHTGVSSSEQMSFEYWIHDVQSLYDNTRK